MREGGHGYSPPFVINGTKEIYLALSTKEGNHEWAKGMYGQRNQSPKYYKFSTFLIIIFESILPPKVAQGWINVPNDESLNGDFWGFTVNESY